MKSSLTLLLSCLFSLYYTNNTWAFQKQNSPYTFSDPTLTNMASKAKQLTEEGDYEEALQVYSALQKKCRAANMDSVAIDLYSEIFTLNLTAKDNDMNRKRFVVDSIQTQEKDPNISGIYYAALASIYLFYEELDSSKKYYDLASNVYTQQKRYLQATHLNISFAVEYYSSFDDLAAAKLYLNKAEQLIAEKLQHHNFFTGDLHYIQILIYYDLQEYEKAIESSLKLLQYNKKNKLISNTELSHQYNNLASIFGQLGDHSNALDYYLAALSLIDLETTEPAEVTYLLYNIGSTYFEKNEYTKAKTYFLKSLKIISEVESLNSELQQDFINNCHYLADCYNHEKQLDSVLYYIDKSAPLSKQIPYRFNETYKLYATYYLGKNDLEKATEYAKKALNLELETHGPKSIEAILSFLLLGELKNHQHKNLEALQFIQKGLKMLSQATLKGDFSNPKLEDVSNKVLLLRVLKYKMPYLNALYNQDHPSVSEKDLYQTAKLNTEAIELINKGMKNRKSQLFWLNTTAIPSFEQAIEIALSIHKKTKNPKYLNEAFVLAERSKSMLMLSKLQEETAASLGGVPKDLIQKEKQLEQNLAKATKRRFDASLKNDLDAIAFQDSIIFHYKNQILQLSHQFEFKYPEYFKLKYTFQTVGIQMVQKALDEQTTFVEYFEGKSKIYAFTITKEEASVHSFKRTVEYDIKVRDFQSILVGITAANKKPVYSYNNFVKIAHELYKTILKKSLNSSQKRLIIIPDGQLGYLPFETFLTQAVPQNLDQAASLVGFSTLPYLIQKYKINYNYSATLFLQYLADKKSPKNGRILALAPNYKNKIAPDWRNPKEQKIRASLAELPGATRELEFLEANFKGSFLYNELATEQKFKQEASNYSILHLAVHGLVNQAHPEFSGLVLFEDNSKTEDNTLYAYEIQQLDLNSDLVVLSACETGIGQYQSGEGVLSIGRDFMAAGVPSMLSTLWSLNDASGFIIIEQFYLNLKQGMEKDEAIRQAKLYYLEQYKGIIAHPALWACFVQFGDYSSISVNTGNNNLLFISLTILLVISIIGFLIFRKRNA